MPADETRAFHGRETDRFHPPNGGKSFLSFPRSEEERKGTRERERESSPGFEIDRKPRSVVANGPLPLTSLARASEIEGDRYFRVGARSAARMEGPFRGRRSRKEEESRLGIIALESGIPRSARGPPGIRGVPRSCTASCIQRSSLAVLYTEPVRSAVVIFRFVRPLIDRRRFSTDHGTRSGLSRLVAEEPLPSRKFSPYILFRYPSLSSNPLLCVYDALRAS